MTRLLDFIAAWRYWLGYGLSCFFGNVFITFMAMNHGIKISAFGYNLTGLLSSLIIPIIYVFGTAVAMRPLRYQGFTRFCPRHWIKLDSSENLMDLWEKEAAYEAWAKSKGYRVAIWHNSTERWVGFHNAEILCLARLSV